MASFFLLTLLLKCIHFLSWPVLALVYPLCASVQAIENDNISETRNLISYWILLSLIYLFEYAFLNILQRFQYWHYMKLMIVVCLVIPDFERASYVYNQLVQLCIYMNPHVAISQFRNWKRVFVNKEDFLMLAEKYITDHGSGALEKLIASMNTEQSLDAETKQAVPTTEKNEMQQKNISQNLDTETSKSFSTAEKNEAHETNIFRLPLEHNDIKDLEMIGKEEVTDGKPANTALCSLKSNENTLAKTEGTEEGGSSPHISACNRSFQKEWTCAICQVTTNSEAALNSHLHGKSHKAACQALKAKNPSISVEAFKKKRKNDKAGEEVESEKRKNDKAAGEGESKKMMINDVALNSSEQKITTCHTKTDQNNNVEIFINRQKYYYRPKKRSIDEKE